MSLNLRLRAQEQENIAKYFCKKGDHYSAGRHYLDASVLWSEAGDSYHCSVCLGEADGEFARCRYTPPPNVSGLVD